MSEAVLRGHSRGAIPRAFTRALCLLLGIELITIVLGHSGHSAAAQEPPSVVVVVTDDQRWDTLWAMPTVQRELADRGVTFSNGFVVNPTCCPSRASILTGRYSHSTGVWRNRPPYGGFQAFDDSSTLATWLQARGYRTALIGKYLNGYHEVGQTTGYVPPGWDHWQAFVGGGYFDYRMNVNGTIRAYGSAPTDYATDVMAADATSFIRNNGGPLLLYFAPKAPHGPFTPAPRHTGAFADLSTWRPPSYNETDMTDKPRWLRKVPRLTETETIMIDERRRDQFRTLLALDEAVGEIVAALRDTGRLNDTLLMFVSDNGYSWGEHRWKRKAAPYEEDIRVPFVLRYDAAIAAPRVDDHLVLNIDLAPTIAELVGIRAQGFDGRSMLPLLSSPNVPWRRDFLVEHVGERIPSYCAVRSEGFEYVLYASGEEELYDLGKDPYQLRNGASRSSLAVTLNSLRARLRRLCDPPPPGLAIPGN